MKWRLVPDLDLERVSELRCLLLGAGTLGCSVARVLLGWGVSNMTLVDSSTVSHSNTVRQSLYAHEDAVQRRHKVHAAKDALLRIRPNMASALPFRLNGHLTVRIVFDNRMTYVRLTIEFDRRTWKVWSCTSPCLATWSAEA